MKTYFKNIAQTLGSMLYGLKITFTHMLKARTSRQPIGVADKDYFEHKEGIFTLQYPFQEFPVPDNGRYKLHNEIDDCIVCDKCAKVCPVNCIDIEPVRAVEEIGKTSDGTSKKIYAAKFDIDMSKCCFCGLCTTVCPTECLTMTKEYDFSVFDIKAHNFEFSDMTPELVDEKKKEFEVYSAEKLKAEAAATKAVVAKPAAAQSVDAPNAERQTPNAKPVFRPKMKKSTDDSLPSTESQEHTTESEKPKAAKPVFRPKVKQKTAESPKADRPTPNADEKSDQQSADSDKPKAAKPVFRPKIKPKKTDE
ncbi:4Fe-4S binding protein [Reichenbachiella agarivorans]|uniref:4Fe-4S binding protein n=1 Tax=Reichenbachiella agarivorans TaxID=2979464 RepID=A0ABY6CJH5_9BACT|nr:4Fe-4S binding protein [Reichenbachiella agarivorans]UXP30680.1 4Fe-4S binding protein [Reichenbachiella agarivorans]